MSDTLTLYARTDAVNAIYRAIGDADGEMTPEQEAQLAAELGAWEEKVDACLIVYRELQALAEARAAEADRLNALAKSAASQADRLRAYVQREMQRRDVNVHDSPLFRAVRVASPWKVIGTAEAPVLRSDVEALPEPVRACVTITPPAPESYAWDRRALLTLMKTQPELAATVATFDRGESLQVK